MKKFAGLKKFVDGINQLNGPHTPSDDSAAQEPEINDRLTSEEFTLSKVARYGFPYHPTCLAIDPVQKLLAIGTARGAIRICGRPGVECHVHHESNAAVTNLQFLINEGGLVSVCNDASLHIWSLRQKQPALIQSLNFKKERITAIHNPFLSKWLYVGTERGNIYMVHVETFKVSGYVISWNHVIDVSCKTHPGPVTKIQSNPQDSNKLLLNFESGICVVWDLRAKKIYQSFALEQSSQYVTCASWYVEGKQFMTGHWDGSLSTWNFRNGKKPEERQMPHATNKSGPNGNNPSTTICCPILKMEWLAGKQGELPLVIFSGGMPYGNKNKGLTLMKGRSKSLLLSEQVIDFQCLHGSPYPTECPEPQALVVLLRNEIVVFDLVGPTQPTPSWFLLPYTFDIHESPVTCIAFFPECPNDMVIALNSMVTQKESPNQSKRQWPFTGGQEGEISQDPTIIITGHSDGSIKFWDATSNMLIACHKVSLSRLFDRTMSRQSSTTSNLSKTSSLEHYDDPYAIQHLCFCPYSRLLSVVCSSFNVFTFSFSTKENVIETPKIDVNFSIEIGSECADSPTESISNTFPDQCTLTKSASDNPLSVTPALSILYHPPFRSVGVKWPPGFQPELICQQIANEPMPNIISLAHSSAYGLMAFGNSVGVAIVDYIRKCTVMICMTDELGVQGEWTELSTPVVKTPLSQTKSNPLSPNMNDGRECANGDLDRKKFQTERRRDRSSKYMKDRTEDHNRLSKRMSAQMTNNWKDQEDGLTASIILPTAGSINSLMFGSTYTRKNGGVQCPSLWVGTSLGTVALIGLSIPPTEQRKNQPVLSNCTGTVLNHQHCILNITLLDKSGNIIISPFNFWRDKDSPNPDAKRTNISNFNVGTNTRQHVCITTEKQIKVRVLPTFKSTYIVEPVSGDQFIVRAEALVVEGGNCISCLNTDGHLKIYSLPTLRLLLDVECGISLADYRMIRTFTVGKGGEATFLTSPTEIQRIAFTKEKEESFVNDYGCLFTLCNLPEQKPKGFLESFFTSAPSSLDREELFGEKSGTTGSRVAEYIPGRGMGHLQQHIENSNDVISKAKMALIERGEKLSVLEDKTAAMNENARSYASAAKALADKYQRRKWYQW